MTFSAPLLPGRGWTLLSPSAHSSLLASRSPRPPRSPSPGPRWPGPLAAGVPLRMLLQPPGRRPPARDRWRTTDSLCTAWPCGPGPCLQTVPSLWDLKPSLGLCVRCLHRSGLLLGSSSPLGKGVGVGMDVVAVLRVVGATFGTAPRAPLWPGSDAFEKQPCFAREGQALCLLVKVSWLPFLWQGTRWTVTRGTGLFCTRRGWRAVDDAPRPCSLGRARAGVSAVPRIAPLAHPNH